MLRGAGIDVIVAIVTIVDSREAMNCSAPYPGSSALEVDISSSECHCLVSWLRSDRLAGKWGEGGSGRELPKSENVSGAVLYSYRRYVRYGLCQIAGWYASVYL